MITIHLPGMESGLGITVEYDVPKAKAKPKTPVKKMSAREETLAGFGLKMMNRDNLDDNQRMQLAYDVVLYLRKQKKAVVRDFLLMHKHHMPEELKDLLGEEFK